jgi:hypothetical protein
MRGYDRQERKFKMGEIKILFEPLTQITLGQFILLLI